MKFKHVMLTPFYFPLFYSARKLAWVGDH
ncbi:hypothetical protein F383_18477 [Gossypium arboreum]|uniref:Uncharacterized protein n=1 Tax=Gossypium arboreum TaxID=29729 RepID=A0A0B0NKZ2_GOSAR|nr:hypothetical protein F383_18477 [Gossypium arboreum]